MDNRTNDQTTSTAKQQSHSKPVAKSLPYITTAKEARFLTNVLFGCVSAKELRNITGSQNIWNTASILRDKGWVIHTINRPVFDRDGLKTHAGYYQLDQSQRTLAQTVLNSFYGASQQPLEIVHEK